VDTLTVKVKRFDPETKGFPVESYQIPFEKGMNLLMVLQYLYEEKGIAFRHSCDVGLCKVCMVKVNGKNRFACKEIIDHPSDVLVIEPVGGFDPVRDLVVSFDKAGPSHQ
jgi:succinate dehydrogenase / fumarate reductase iron-sulfur subunit